MGSESELARPERFARGEDEFDNDAEYRSEITASVTTGGSCSEIVAWPPERAVGRSCRGKHRSSC